MNLEQLQAMSDAELNELSAVKVMKFPLLFNYYVDINGNHFMVLDGQDSRGYALLRGYRDDKDNWVNSWKPTTDMNNAMELERTILTTYDKYDPSTTYFNSLVKATEAVGILTMDNLYKLIHATPRQRTIASILAKEEE